MSSTLTQDLSRNPPCEEVECDVCVVGAGPVGLTVARALAERHRSVTLLDRGPTTAQQQSDSDEIIFDRQPYRGATVGRAFGAGGTSSLWGGQLLPVRRSDLLGRPHIGAPAWPVSYEELAPCFAALESWLQVAPGDFALQHASRRHPLSELHWAQWEPRLSKWTPFGRRNLDAAFGPAMGARISIRGYANARAEQWELQRLAGRQRVVGLTARAANGNAMNVRAREYIICAGALESARCVLEMQEAAGGLAPGVDALTGRFLHDHLSMRIARARIVDRSGFQRLFAPTFAGSTMRSLRMELCSDYLSREGLPGLYVHFVFEIGADSGFALMRDVLRGRQYGNLRAAFAAARRLPPALPGVAEIAFDRLMRKRLSFPSKADIFLQCDFEQRPIRENRLYLAKPATGGHRPMHVDWESGGDAIRVGMSVERAIARFWSANHLDRIARLEYVDFAASATMQANNPYDIHHPAGTTRMSADPEEGVVDANLLIHGTSNAYVAGSAVFPSLGAANPTFTAMAMGLRLAGFLDRKLA